MKYSALFLAVFLILPGCVQVFPEAPTGDKIIVIDVEHMPPINLPASLRQIIVDSPRTSAQLNVNFIAVRDEGMDTIRYTKGVVLADILPNVMSYAIIDAFLESNKVNGVAPNGSGVTGDYILLTDIDYFGLTVSADQKVSAYFEIACQLVDQSTRKVIATKRFESTIPLLDKTIPSLAKALNKAVLDVLALVVEWTVKKGQ